MSGSREQIYKEIKGHLLCLEFLIMKFILRLLKIYVRNNSAMHNILAVNEIFGDEMMGASRADIEEYLKLHDLSHPSSEQINCSQFLRGVLNRVNIRRKKGVFVI
jgi:hypothetical protein